jgi:multiple sugar transport system substrate-binding protein
MQQPLGKNRHLFPIIPPNNWVGFVVGLALTVVLMAGCGSDITPEPEPNANDFRGVSLIICCPDAAFAAAITPAIHSWAYRTGATVAIDTKAMNPNDNTDIGILPVSELGSWTDRGELALVPGVFRNADHPFQWTGLLPAYREQLIEWGGQAQAIPLAGDGSVIVYRADRLADPNFVATFEKLFGRGPTIPATWEDFAELAVAYTAVDGQPSLPSLTGHEVAEWFFRIAACYDRQAITDADRARAMPFQFDVATTEPRLDAPGFVAAARWFTELTRKDCFPAPSADASSTTAEALAAGRAALAIVTLGELAKLPRENGVVAARFGIAAIPGTRTATDSRGEQVSTVLPNYVPYFSGGWLGVVRKRCPNTEAAFDLLAELGGPLRSFEILSTPGLGAGPFRIAHLERERIRIWYGYQFDLERTNILQDALRRYVRQEVKNPVIGLRAPDQQLLSAAAETELLKLIRETPPQEVLTELAAAWKKIDEQTPKATRLRWRQLSAGFN